VRRGKNRANIAVAHSLLIAIYHVLGGAQFRDLSSDYYTNFNKEKKINSYVKLVLVCGLCGNAPIPLARAVACRE